MSAHRKKKHHHEEHENHERWLVSGYDMMTLLFAVFVVLFAISSTNVSKVKALQQSLREAFSGPVFSGGRAMMQTGDTSSDSKTSSSAPPIQAISPQNAVADAFTKAKASQSQADAASAAQAEAAAAAKEEQGFVALKKKIDTLVDQAGIGAKVSTTITRRGLKVRLLTDNLFFQSGSAAINGKAVPTLDAIGGVIATEGAHPVEVDGHTDDHPIATSQYPSNWQLSGARAGAVVQVMVRGGLPARRVSLAGYGSEVPAASNATAGGRAKNRRVEIVLTRLHGAETAQGGTTP
jgi:chemotaxis protein MotB